MFLLDPINSITSVQFYKKVAAQSGGRTAGYLAYLGLVFAVLATAAFKTRLGPSIDGTFAWLEKSVPVMEFSGGRVRSEAGPTTLRHPEIPDIALQIDTTRTEPVTIQVMQELKVKGFLASNALYMIDPKGQLTVNDFSKAAAGDSQPLKIDAAFFRKANEVLSRALYPVTFALAFAFFLAWKAFSSLFFSLVAMCVAAIAQVQLPFGSLVAIAVYAQTLIIAIQTIFLFMKAPLPLAPLVSLAATTTYIWLAVKATGAPQPAEAA